MAVMTQEGAPRGSQSQCAEVSKALQSVKAMVDTANAVCFGLGPEGKDHRIINRFVGEVNQMEDDGINYLQRLYIVPEEQVAAVQAELSAYDHEDNGYCDPNDAGFTGPGR